MKHKDCVKCGVTLVGQRIWERQNIEERAQARAEGRNVHKGYGMCAACHTRATRAGTLPEQTDFMPVEVVVEDWQELVDRHRSQAANIRLLAPRLGMSEAALEQAILRAKRRGLLERAA